MRQREIAWLDMTPGLDVVLQYKEPRGAGVGGTVEWVGPIAVKLCSGTANVRRVIWKREIHQVCVEEYLDADECLNYGADGSECEGPVDYWHSGGINGRAWPRCEKHGLQRLEDHENSMAKYADSDVAPSWFDPSDWGERWDPDDP